MRNHLLAVAVFLIVAAPLSSARSDDVPNLHVDQLCHGIASQGADSLQAGDPNVSFARCMKAEQDDREQLKKRWSEFSAWDKKHCVAETQMGGESSYTELITCLEMARDVRKLRLPNEPPPKN